MHFAAFTNTGEFNLGIGNGYSVQEVIDAAREVTGLDFQIVRGERRDGDPDRLVSNASKAQEKLGWSPQFSDLQTIISTAWEWHQNSPVHR